ncbi:MAG: leucine-rich repeat protein, partial [Prevotella sp.]|nr:leucine-rich repeat protein [Prevotella sp.]
FNDPKVKAICVDPARGWDANGDGELTKDEAAAVTTLGTAFTGNTEIETFGELKYFTGLKWGDVPALTGGDNQHGAFDGCTNLRFVELPSNIEQIMNFSFRGCTSLAIVNIPSGVHTILDDAFQGCTALSYASMPQALENIGAHAFDGCSSLRWMAFPNHVISYGDQAFNGCSSLTQVTVNSSVPGDIDGNPFPTRADISLTVPAHAAATYQTTDYWKEFKNFKEQEPNWTGEFTDANGDVYQYETGYYAQLKHHAASSSRTTFTVLSQITVDGADYPVRSISENAINASYLTTLTIPASITAVKRDAFGCQPTADGMTLKTIFMLSSVPPTAERFQAWEDELASYNAYMKMQQQENPDLQFTPLSLKDITLMVPAGAKTAYEADNTWKKFTVVEMTPGNGNADGIGDIDINDVLAVIDYILGKTVPETFDPAAADVNGDGRVTIADAAAVVNIILGMGN